MKKVILFTIAGIFLLSVFSSMCSGNESNTQTKSKKYYTDSEYRKNVDTIAEAYGKSPEEVERMAEAVAREMQKNK